MSYFNGRKLQVLRASRGLSLTEVFERTGISRAQISKIENGKSDPRMSTVTRLLSCYAGSLSDLELTPQRTLYLADLRQRSDQAAEALLEVGIGPSDPVARLARKESLGIDVRAETGAIASRS